MCPRYFFTLESLLHFLYRDVVQNRFGIVFRLTSMTYYTLQCVIPCPICQLMSNGNLLNGYLVPADFWKGLMMDILNEIQPTCPNRTKTDFRFRPLTDVMYDSWTSKGS